MQHVLTDDFDCFKPVLDPDHIHVFVDGALSRDKSTGTTFGGWGLYLLYKQHKHTHSGATYNTSTIEMEFEAIIQAMRLVTKNHRERRINVYCDNAYCVQQIFNNLCRYRRNRLQWTHSSWVNAPGKHGVYKRQVKTIVELSTLNTVYKWIKGHSEIEGNEAADVLAVAARQELRHQWDQEQRASNYAEAKDALWKRSVL